jgi:hypothetical protein
MYFSASISLEIRELLKGLVTNDILSCHIHVLHRNQIGSLITYCTFLSGLYVRRLHSE